MSKMQQTWSTDWKRRWSARAILGTVARSDGYCPVDIKDWRKVKKDNAATMLQLIQVRKFIFLKKETAGEIPTIGL